MRVASEVGNRHSEFGHARPSGSRVIRYVRNGRTDGQKQSLLPPCLRAEGIITFKLACLTYTLLTTGQHLMCAGYYTITALHALYGRIINFSSTCREIPLNLVRDRLVTSFLQSGMDYLLISDIQPLSTPSNAV